MWQNFKLPYNKKETSWHHSQYTDDGIKFISREFRHVM